MGIDADQCLCRKGINDCIPATALYFPLIFYNFYIKKRNPCFFSAIPPSLSESHRLTYCLPAQLPSPSADNSALQYLLKETADSFPRLYATTPTVILHPLLLPLILLYYMVILLFFQCFSCPLTRKRLYYRKRMP